MARPGPRPRIKSRAGSRASSDLRLEPDLDAIEALASERESLWRRVAGADFLSEDEKRVAVGYGRRDAGE